MLRSLIIATGLLAITSPVSVSAQATPKLHGMTISCPMNGQIWGTSAMRTAIQENRKLGVNRVAIHPYAHIQINGQIRFRPADKVGYLSRAVEIAKAENMPLFWKPHISYWGSFEWRGAITFEHESEWKRFFTSYEDWIISHAKFAEKSKIKLFAVGTELDKTLHRKEWLRIIKRVRQNYSGKLTYAANWDSFQRVPFWRELDIIGIQAYFPVTSVGSKVTASVIDAHWKKLLAQLKAYSAEQARPILFTELGYTRSTAAGEKPWDPAFKGGSDEARRIQALLLRSALRNIESAPFVRGAYLWKWMPGFAPWERDFSMRDEGVQALIRKEWKQ